MLQQKGSFAQFFNRTVQGRMTWFTFVVNLAINANYAYWYRWPTVPTADGSGKTVIDQSQGIMLNDQNAVIVAHLLSMISLVSSSVTLAMYVVVRAKLTAAL
jgi:hypothetical protein